MKNTFLKTFLFITFISATLSSCINSDVYDNIDTACVTVTPTKTVADIYAMATSQPQLYEGDDIIEAYVTSSDAGGTFYKSLSMVSIDGTKAFSIPIKYKVYTRLTIIAFGTTFITSFSLSLLKITIGDKNTRAKINLNRVKDIGSIILDNFCEAKNEPAIKIVAINIII